MWITSKEKAKKMIELTLPYPPSVNHYKKVGSIRATRRGKLYQTRFNSTETLAFICLVINICRTQGVKSFGSATISLEVDVYPPDKRKRDLSNILKVLEDSLMRGGCFDDDSQIALLLVKRCSIIKQGKIIVRIEAHEPS